MKPKRETPTQRQKLKETIKISEQVNNKEEFYWKKEDPKVTLVDENKLEKIEAKKEKRREAKEKKDQIRKLREKNSEMSYTQALMIVSHRNEDNKNKSRDIHIHNFDISHGKELLLSNSDLDLVYGHRYGLVGRNGSGKTTLLKQIVSRELQGIPSHLRILHVEQEVNLKLLFLSNSYFS